MFRRLNAKRAKGKKEAKEQGRDPKLMQKQFKRELNALQKGEEPPAKKEEENLHMRPKYKNVLRVGVNPNFLSPNLKKGSDVEFENVCPWRLFTLGNTGGVF